MFTVHASTPALQVPAASVSPESQSVQQAAGRVDDVHRTSRSLLPGRALRLRTRTDQHSELSEHSLGPRHAHGNAKLGCELK